MAAPPAKPVDPWQAQRSRVEAARGTLSAGHAMRLLLDVQGAGERDLLAEFDRMLAGLPAHSALALGVHNGQLRWRTQARGADSGTASRLALQRCNEGLPTLCRVVMRDGEFSSDAFLDATATLGEADIASVRSTTLRAVASHLKAWKEQQVAAALPTPAPRPADRQPVAPAGPMPARARDPARSAGADDANLRRRRRDAACRGGGRAARAAARHRRSHGHHRRMGARPSRAACDAGPGIARRRAGRDARRAVRSRRRGMLRRFGAAMKRLRWISALAMGENRNGVIAYSYTFNWSKEMWAHERALADCARATVSPCVVVFVNGDVRNGELASLAGTLSARPQAAVRRAFVESTKQTLARGTGL